MKIIELTKEYTPDEFIINRKSAIAIGKFDGVHKGHEKLLAKLKEFGSHGYTTVVFTFDGSLTEFFTGKKSGVLSTKKEQEEILRDLGIDVLARYPVNADSVAVSPADFVRDYLVAKLNAGVIIAGYDCSFGAKGAGDVALLKEMGKQHDFEAFVIDKVVEEGSNIEISSTYVRSEVLKGEMEHVTRLLGEPYSICGRVAHGRKLGKAVLSMPTVNLIPEPEKLLPPFGVYYSRVHVGTNIYRGITNIGRKPTVNDTLAVTAETYIYDFDDDLYGEHIKVDLLGFKRPEMKFASIEELKKQMRQDMAEGRLVENIL